MSLDLDERRTIFALASGLGKSAIAVIRLSGPDTARAIAALAGGAPKPRYASVRRIIDPQSSIVIDRGLVLWFPGPESFTGEDSAELQVHGSPAVVSLLLKVLSRMPGLRLAKPGEFARRALENGKLDLVSIEALGDLVEAETEQQRRFAVECASGHLQRAAELWRRVLLESLVLIESELDFSDEQDVSPASRAKIVENCQDILREMMPLAVENPQAERIREGLTVLIAGPPNSGKSTLLNAIAKRDVAIVSERAGTTRDLIEVKLDLGGFPVNLVDTAGIRDSDDPIEQEGVRRALRKSVSCDLVLWLTPVGEPAQSPPDLLRDRPLWTVMTKADEAGGDEMSVAKSAVAAKGLEGEILIEISARTGFHLDELIAEIAGYAKQTMSIEGSLVVANERQRSALCSAVDAIHEALNENAPLEIVSDDLRRAGFYLESLVGKVGVEDVLDEIFARFCIGK
jgi:tRNA modification GTPase